MSGAGRVPVLQVENLTVEFNTAEGRIRAVEDVSFSIGEGETLGLVGESGSGKSVTSLAIAGLTGYSGGVVTGGAVRVLGRDILAMGPKERSDTLGRDIGMVFQQPTRSLNPTMRVGVQIAETIRRHESVSKKVAWDRAVEMLERVRIPHPAERARQYPHTFSGGMSQRVAIAMALACGPKLLIADEPTTALDVTVQAAVLDLVADIQREMGIAVLMITHNLGVVARSCKHAAVMYCGQIVEYGPVRDVLAHPAHPYTEGLVGAVPGRGVGKRLLAVPGSVPSPGRMPTGCRFSPRCVYAVDGLCDAQLPLLLDRTSTRSDRCLHPDGAPHGLTVHQVKTEVEVGVSDES